MLYYHWQLFDYRGIKKHEKFIETIPEKIVNGLLFHQDNLKIVPVKNQDDLFVESNEQATLTDIDGANVVLVDLPPSKEMVENLLSGKKPERIYVHFYKKE